MQIVKSFTSFSVSVLANEIQDFANENHYRITNIAYGARGDAINGRVRKEALVSFEKEDVTDAPTNLENSNNALQWPGGDI